jgi:IclR family transcriptional regulator, acetate operon repressor
MRALDRVIAILEAVADSPQPLTPTVVAARSELSLSTVSRLMRQMADQGLLNRSPASGAYELGVRILRIAQAALQPNDLVQAALPEMQHLRNLTRETASLFVRRGDVRICLAQIQSDQPIRRVVPVGFTTELHGGATGEVLLAGMTAAEREHYIVALPMSAAALTALRARLEEIDSRGFTMAVGGWIEEVSAMAAPILENNATVASLSVAGPSYRFTLEVMEQFTDELVSAARRVSRRLAATAITD